MKNLIDSFIKIIDNEDFNNYENAYDLMMKKVDQTLSFETAKEAVKNGLSEIYKVLEEGRTQNIIDLPLDRERLKKISYMASEKAFDKSECSMPIYFFSEIKFTGDIQESRKLILNKMNRGEFTNPIMSQLAGNEEEWYANTMKNHVAAVAIGMVLHKGKVETIDTTTEDKYWYIFQEKSQSLYRDGLTPILFIDNPARPQWIPKWRRSIIDKESSIPKDLIVSRENISDGSYLYSFNGVNVYNANIRYGKTYLLVRELFQELLVTDFGGKMYFKSEIVEGNYENKAFVDLELIFAINVIIRDYPIYCLQYHKIP